MLWLGGTTFHGTPALRISVSGWSTRDADADRSVDAILAAVDAVRTQRVSSQLALGVDGHLGHRDRVVRQVAGVAWRRDDPIDHVEALGDLPKSV